MTSRVFVLEKTRRDYDLTTATEFGQITYLFDLRDHRPSIFESQEYCEMISRRLRELRFDPEKDSFCLVGSQVAVCLTMHALSQTFEAYDVLIYNSTINAYECETLRSFSCRVR